MNNQHIQQSDIYYDQASARSPNTQRHQQQMLQRQPSRPFEAYSAMNTGDMFPPQDQHLRYDTNRFDRMNGPGPGPGPMNGGAYDYDMNQAQTWNPNAFNANNQFSPAYAATTRPRPQARARHPLPNSWMDPQQLQNQSSYGPIGPSPLGPMQGHRGSDPQVPDGEELIPTAIVIKNIPFAVRKEQLVDLMTQLNLPLPYAFNYHFDGGVFRGLAFANFTSAEETDMVIRNLNAYEIQGRRLRVEYKKMLPLQERERIEREKRERRGQLEEQHRPIHTPSLQNQPSMSSIASHQPVTTPSPISNRQEMYDLNDLETRRFYDQLIVFKESEREALIFPASLSNSQRRTVHTIAHHMQLAHISQGNGEQRQVHVRRADRSSPPMGGTIASIQAGDASRRALNRAATIDFNEARNPELGNYNVLRGQQSTGLLGIPDSPGAFGTNQNLRAAKSVADLRSFTPSPVPSINGFQQNHVNNISRYQDYGPGSVSAGTPNLSAAPSGVFGHRGEDAFVNGFNNMSLRGNNANGLNGESPRRLRPRFSWGDDHQPNSSNGPVSAGAIGSNRSVSVNNNYDTASSRDRGLPVRQPHGPSDRGASAFSRGRQAGHQQRGSDEMRQQSNVEIIVE